MKKEIYLNTKETATQWRQWHTMPESNAKGLQRTKNLLKPLNGPMSV